MGFWIFMMIMNLLIPVSMIGFGYLFYKRPPKNINAIAGYRTSMSTKNLDTWKFANYYFAKMWFYWGLILLLLTVLSMCFLLGKDTDTVGTYGGIICFVQMVPMLAVIYPTERALRKTFDINGNRK